MDSPTKLDPKAEAVMLLRAAFAEKMAAVSGPDEIQVLQIADALLYRNCADALAALPAPATTGDVHYTADEIARARYVLGEHIVSLVGPGVTNAGEDDDVLYEGRAVRQIVANALRVAALARPAEPSVAGTGGIGAMEALYAAVRNADRPSERWTEPVAYRASASKHDWGGVRFLLCYTEEEARAWLSEQAGSEGLSTHVITPLVAAPPAAGSEKLAEMRSEMLAATAELGLLRMWMVRECGTTDPAAASVELKLWRQASKLFNWPAEAAGSEDTQDAKRWRAIEPYLSVNPDGDSEGSWCDLTLEDPDTGEDPELSPSGPSSPAEFVDQLIAHPEDRIGYPFIAPPTPEGE